MKTRTILYALQGFWWILTAACAGPLLYYALPANWQWLCMWIAVLSAWNAGRLHANIEAERRWRS